MADTKPTTFKKSYVYIYIYMYIVFFPSKKACTSSAVFRYPINRNACHGWPESVSQATGRGKS